MSIHNDLRILAERIGPESDTYPAIMDILDRYPADTGHEWKTFEVVFTDDPKEVPQERVICALCGADRILSDEANPCDNTRPVSVE